MEGKRKRIWELDFLRGFSIILVVFDHAFFDYGYLFDWSNCGVPFLEKISEISYGYVNGDLRLLWRPAFLFIFFFVSGVCTAVSRNNLVRSLKLWGVAVLVSVVTYVADLVAGGDNFILMGVLHCLALCIFLYALLELLIKGTAFVAGKLAKKEIGLTSIRWATALIIAAICGVGIWLNQTCNPKLYDIAKHGATVEGKNAIYGLFFYVSSWWTGDYFPLFPYFNFFLIGALVGKIVYYDKKTKLPLLDGCWHVPITVAGKHSLLIYLGGQVVAILLGVLLSLCFLGDAVLF